LEVVESGSPTKALKAGDVIDTGHAYDFRLTRVRDDVDLMTEFHVYLIDVDPNGASSVFYNMTFGSSVGDEDRKIDVLDPPPLINLVRLALSPDSPAGTDTILLLVTEKPIPKDRLSFPGVIDLNASKGEEDDPLHAILTDVGQVGGKGDPTTSDNWSMQHLVLRTVVADKPSSLKDPVFPVDNKFPN
ncbi:MAG TPA: hypothetical protein VL501_06335, partial [Pyrinomonadaceae bacterium]|nr:hypothetical protein [Pyrinomonadaceae bacterium]